MPDNSTPKFTNQLKKDEITSEKRSIFIKKEAIRNMITHVLRFGNEALDNSVAVMGVCLGNIDLNGEKIVVINAIPITHGNNVETEFTSEIRSIIAQIEKQYKDLSVLGWYHSHPGRGLHFSDVDKKNHQFIQKKEFPRGFCIIFDHTLMLKDENLGLKVYRLNNYKKPTEYHEVPHEIEIPATLDYFKWCKKFVEDSQKKAPILIKEVSESSPSIPKGLQEIPMSEEKLSLIRESEEFLQVKPIISGFQEGSSKFMDLFFNTFKSQLGTWTRDVNEGTEKGMEYSRDIINQMKESIFSSLIKLKSWFEKNLEEITDLFKTNIIKQIDKRIEAQKELESDINSSKELIIKELSTLIEEKINHVNSEIESSVKTINENLSTTIQTNSKLNDLLNKISENILKNTNEINNFNNETIKSIEITNTPFEKEIINIFEKLRMESQPTEESFLEIDKLLQEFKKISETFQNM
ncbi:MAG: hypothetical protein ACTSRI_11255 [Promethearchaeota archaeon]